MTYFAGLDVSLRSRNICVVDERSELVTEGKTDAEVVDIVAFLSELDVDITEVGLEAGTLTQYLTYGLKFAGYDVICMEARQVKAALSAMRNKTDKNDARGIAQLLRSGWYSRVHIKSMESHRVRALLSSRRAVLDKCIDLENEVSGILKIFGVKLPSKPGHGSFDRVVRPLIEADGALSASLLPLLSARLALYQTYRELDNRARHLAEQDAVCQRLMTAPGVAYITALTFKSGVDDPTRFKRSRTVAAHFGLTPRRFQSGDTAETGRPGYHPKMMLKLYVYGYLNRVQSSRRLEVEANRNVELMWLTNRLAPDFKTIADFRKDNGEAIRLVCREFVVLCKKLDLLSTKLVAIDGSKFKAVNSRDKNFTRAKMERRLHDVESTIERYLARLDQADRNEPPADDAETLKAKVAKLREEMKQLKKFKVRMLKAPDQQLSLTDPDARSMNSRGTGIVGYNVQCAVEAKNHLIVAHGVSNVGSDRRQLSPMAKEAKAILGTRKLEVVADRGYYNGDEIKACELNNTDAYVPKTFTSNNKAKGQFDRSAFRYIKRSDQYECPAGERLIYRFTRTEAGKVIRRYWTSACTDCAIKAQCTTGDYRRVSRWEHEDVLERAEQRLRRKPDRVGARRSLVEHPFGTIKSWTSASHLLTRRISGVSTEVSLQILAYNIKRAVINLLGTKKIVATIQA